MKYGYILYIINFENAFIKKLQRNKQNQPTSKCHSLFSTTILSWCLSSFDLTFPCFIPVLSVFLHRLLFCFPHLELLHALRLCPHLFAFSFCTFSGNIFSYCVVRNPFKAYPIPHLLPLPLAPVASFYWFGFCLWCHLTPSHAHSFQSVSWVLHKHKVPHKQWYLKDPAGSSLCGALGPTPSSLFHPE